MPCVSRSSSSVAASVVERVVVVERAGHELDVAGQPRPDLLAPRRAGVLLGRLAGQRLEVAVAPVAPGEAEHHEAGRQQAPVGQVVDGRDQLLAGQVAGDAEDHQRARAPGSAAAAGPAGRAAGSTRRLLVDGSGLLSGIARVEQLRDTGGAVGQVQAQQRAAALGERLPVAGGLGGLQLRRSVYGLPGTGRSSVDRAGDLQERRRPAGRPCGTGRWSAGTAAPSRR